MATSELPSTRELEDHQITRQPGQGRFRADLGIDDKLIIEIKFNLNATSKHQLLVGQLEEYRDWDGQVILLLIGGTEPNFNDRR